MEAKQAMPRLVLVKSAESVTVAPQRPPAAYDHHVLAFRAQKSARAYVDYICADRGLTIEDLRIPNRTQAMMLLRGMIGYALKHKFGWSYPRIGRFFERDHATIRNCMRRYCEETGHDFGELLRGNAITEPQMKKFKSLVDAGETLRTAADICGISRTGAYKRAIKAGWYTPAKRKRAGQ